MHILATDLSGSNTGWARWRPGLDLPISGAKRLCDSQDQCAGAFIAIHKLIASIHNDLAIDLIVREAPIVLRTDTVAGLMLNIGIAAHVVSYAKVKNIPCDPVAIDTWRGTWLGRERLGIKGEALKQLSVARCRQFGMDPSSHDEAEAIGILDHKMHELGIQPPWRIAHPFLAPL